MSEANIEMDLVLRALLFATLHQMELSDRIDVLKSAGWTDSQIGAAVGLTRNAVEKRRAAAKKGKGAKDGEL